MTDPGEPRDEALMQRVVAGDHEALTVLYDRHHRALYTFLVRWTGDDTAAEDLMHETFLRLLDRRTRYDASGAFRTWLFRIGRNLATDRFRRLHAHVPIDPEHGEHVAFAMDERPDALQQLGALEDRDRLAAALGRLSPAQREVLLLRANLDLSHRELARELGCTEGAVRVRLHRAVAALRRAWFREEA